MGKGFPSEVLEIRAVTRVKERPGFQYLYNPRLRFWSIKVRFGETPKPAGKMPTLPEIFASSPWTLLSPVRVFFDAHHSQIVIFPAIWEKVGIYERASDCG